LLHQLCLFTGSLTSANIYVIVFSIFKKRLYLLICGRERERAQAGGGAGAEGEADTY